MYRVEASPGAQRRAPFRTVLVALAVGLLGASILAVPLASYESGVAPSGAGAPAPLAAKVTPALTVSPTSGPVGTPVTFSAVGFAHASAYTITSPGSTVCSGTTSSTGTYSCSYTLPPAPGGSITFTGADAKATAANAVFLLKSNLFLDPSSGLVGTTFHLLGTGFGGMSSKTGKGVPYPAVVQWTEPSGANVTVCSVETDPSGNGTFGCSYVLPAAPAGVHTFFATTTNFTSVLTAVSGFDVLPGLTAGPGFGPVGTGTTFAGTGFAPTATVVVSWSGGPACSGESLDTGSFYCNFTIPFGTPGGPYNFTGSDGANHASTQFVVTYLTVAPTGGPVGSRLTFTGGGFAPQKTISLGWPGGSVCVGTKSTGAGGYTCAFTLPPTPTGSYLFTASDGIGDTALAAFTVEPALSLSPSYGDPGTTTNISGTGFGASLSVTVRWASSGGTTSVACSPHTNAVGGFSCLYPVPLSAPGGTYTVTATDAASDSATGTFVVTYLTATPATGPRGTGVTLVGGGFLPGATITLTWGGTVEPSSLCTPSVVTTAGQVSCRFTTAYRPSGSYPFVVTDSAGNTASAAFNVTPHLSLSEGNGYVGSPLTFSATGFAPTALVSVAWANTTLACSAVSSKEGSANCTITLPPTPAGMYVFTASDADAHSASSPFVVLSSLTVHPTSGVGGASVVFVATGFGASTSVTITSTLGTVCSPKTGANGSFSCAYSIPFAPSSAYVFTASDDDANVATATFTIGPRLNVSVARGPVGTLLAFSGTGFAPGYTANVTWSEGLACDAAVMPSGGFSCTFTVAQSAAGPYTFTARDYEYPTPKKGRVGNTATALFQIVPSLGFTPDAATVGSSDVALGEGFPAGATGYVNGSAGTLCAAISDAFGTFRCSFHVPPMTAGPQVLSGATSPADSATGTLTILSLLVLAPTNGTVGTAVGATASGLPGPVPVAITWAGGLACSGSTSVVGAFSCSFVFPATPTGTYRFSANLSGTLVASASFVLQPKLVLSPNLGPVGTKVLLRGTGYASHQSFSVSSSLGSTCSGKTETNGSFECNYTVPTTTDGSYVFTANDSKSNVAHASFTVGSVLKVTPTSGVVGTALRFTASGFAGSTAMTVGWSGGTVCHGTTGPAGGFSCNTTMPAATFGAHTFTATAGPTASAVFTVEPSLAASPTSGGVGSLVSFAGAGYPLSATATVGWSGSTSCSASVNASGGFLCSLSIPAGTAGGVYLFNGSDGHGHSATAPFTVVTGLVGSPTHGPATTLVTFNGTNFAPAGVVNVTWVGGLACSGTANATGAFGCTFSIPTGAMGGPTTFAASGPGGHSASALFTVTFIKVVPNGIEVGTQVNVSGGGFTPGSAVSTHAPWGNTVCAVTAGPSGAFSCTVSVPANAPTGMGEFVTEDADSNEATATVGILSVATPTITPSPADVNEPVTFGEIASTGGAATYSWFDLPSGCASTAASFTCEPSASGTSSVYVKVAGPGGYTVNSSSVSLTVFAAPGQAPPTPSVPSADLEQPVTFTAHVTGGSGGGSYAWSAGSGLGCDLATTGATLSCTPTTAGNYTVSYQWTDSDGSLAVGGTSLTFVVNAGPTQAAAKPSQPAADLDQSISFTAQTSGGSGGGSYAWSASSGLGCALSTTGPTLPCTPSATGTFSVSYAWTDSDGIAATGATALSYTVHPDPTVGTPTSTPKTSVDVNQSVTFQVTASGGFGALAYTWNGLPAGCAGTNATVTCSPTAPVSGASITVTVKDADNYSVASAAYTFTVYPPLAVAAPTASVPSADVGQSVTFTVVAVNGSGSLSYSWVDLPPSCAGSTASVPCSPSAAVNASITVTVTDSDHASVTSAPLLFTVYRAPSESAPTASRFTSDVGQSVTFTATTTGGSGGGRYAWSASAGLGCNLTAAGPTLSCAPSASGSQTVSFLWTDSNGLVAKGTGTLTYTVHGDPQAPAPTPSAGSVDVGQTLRFQEVAVNGSGGYGYIWSESAPDLNCTLTDSPTVSCVPTTVGSYTVSVVVTDSNGVSASSPSSSAVTVGAAPSVQIPTPNRLSADVTQTVMFMTSGTGGSGSLSYTWTAPGGLNCGASATSTLVCVPTAAGTYTVSVYATDSNDVSSAKETSASFTVDSLPTVTAPSSPNATADVGEKVVFHTTPTGGAAPFTYTWTTPANLGCTVSDTAQITCQPTVGGSYQLSVSATDGNGATTATETSASSFVYAAPTVAVPSAPTNPSADVGEAVVLETTASGGSGHDLYTWSTPVGLGCTPRTGAQIGCTPVLPGTYSITVSVTDSNGVTSANQTLMGYLVYPAPLLALEASPSTFLQGKKVTFAGLVVGGTGTYTYTWSGLPAGCRADAAAVLTCTPKGPGTFVIGLLAEDSDKVTSFDNVSITVQPSFLGLPAEEGYIVVGTIVLGVAAAAGFFLIRSSRRRARERHHEF